MALFDGTVDIRATPDSVWDEICRAVQGQKVLFEKPKRLLAVAELGTAFVYLLAERGEGVIRLRHIVDREARVVRAFQEARSFQDFLFALQATPPDENLQMPGQQRLAQLRAAAERGSVCVQSSPPPARILTWSGQPAAVLSAVVKKPFPLSEDSGPNPWNPRIIFAVTFIISYIVTGIVLGFNWRRLGKPQWVWPTVIISAIGSLTLMGLVGVVLSLIVQRQWTLGVAVAVLVTGFMINIGFVSTIYGLQYTAYKKWQETRSRAALLSHEYNLGKSLLTAALVLVALLVSAGVFAFKEFARMMPQTFQSSDFVMTYPGYWEALDPDQQELCQTDEYLCLLVLNEGYSTFITFITDYLDQGTSVEDYETWTWDYLSSTNPDIDLRRQESMQIDGQSAALREFVIPDDDPSCECGDYHALQVYFIVGTAGYEFTFESTAPDAFRNHYDDVMRIIATLDILPGGSDGPSV